ncbi:MAG TPA: PPC domain-containing protein [Pirellulales bacterium]|nr:PPC domain-containing protein [Pirellulales bacterium]
MLRDSAFCILAFTRRFSSAGCGWLALGCLLVSASVAQAQIPAPTLNSIFPPGGQQGATSEVTLAGAELDDATTILFNRPGMSAVPKMTEAQPAKPVPKKFMVTIGKDVPTGLCEARVVTPYGISNVRAFQVGNLPEALEIKPHNKPEKANDVSLNSTISGTSDPEGLDYYRFAAKKGQRVLIDCWAQRLDSKLDGTLILRDANGAELERSLDVHHRDPFLDVTIPADGQYLVEVHDFLYKGGPENFYRLTISTAPYVDFIFPCSGEPGKKSKFTLYGRNLPGGTPDKSLVMSHGVLEKLEVEIELPGDPLSVQKMPINTYVDTRDAYQDAFEYRLKTPQGESNPVNIFYAEAPLVLEQEPDNNDPAKAQKLNVPCEVVGQFNPKGDQDWYTFDAKKGQVLWLEVVSQRLGLTTDPYMLIQKVTKKDKTEQVSDVAEVDDFVPDKERGQQPQAFDLATDDPAYRLTVTEDTTYRVLVKDLYSGSRGSPIDAYRFIVRPETPDFHLLAIAEGPVDDKNPQQLKSGSPIVFKGGSTILRVIASRRDGFDGEIALTVEGLPEGLTCLPMTMGPKIHSAALVISAAENAPAWSGTVKVIGKAKIKDQEVVREARAAAILWEVKNPQNEPMRTRVTQDVAIGVNSMDEMPAAIQLGEAKPLEVKMGEKLTIPIKVTRRGDFKGSLKLKTVGLPKEMTPGELDIAAAANDGNLTVEAKPNTPPGTYSFFMEGSSQVNYRKNPKAAEIAVEAQKQAEKGAAEAATVSKAANDKALAAMKALVDAQAAVKAANDQLAAKTKAVADADAAAKAATDLAQAKAKELMAFDAQLKTTTDQLAAKVKELADADPAVKAAAEAAAAKAKEQADSDSAVKAATDQVKAAGDAAAQKADDQGLKNAKAKADQALAAAQEKQKGTAAAKGAADKALTDLQAKQKAAADAKAALDKTLADTQAKQKAAADAKTAAEKALADAGAKQKQAAADKAALDKTLADTQAKQPSLNEGKAAADKVANEAQQKLKAAEAAKTAATQKAKEATEAAKPKNLNMQFISTPVTITIHPKK